MTDKFIFFLPDGSTFESFYSMSDLLSMTVGNTLLKYQGEEYKIVKKVKEIDRTDGFCLNIYLEKA